MERPHSIKDKNNLVSYLLWSGSDYSDNFTNIISGCSLKRSSFKPVNGDCDIEVISTVEGYQHVRLGSLDASPDEVYTGTVCIYNNSSSKVHLRLIEQETNSFNDVYIQPNNSIQKVTITRTITSTSTLMFYLVLREPATVHIDNITLTRQ